MKHRILRPKNLNLPGILGGILLLLLLAGCAGGLPFLSSGGGEAAGAEPPAEGVPAGTDGPAEKAGPGVVQGDGGLVLASRSFRDLGRLDGRFSLEGGNVSPEIHWSGVPSGTASLVLMVYDFTPLAEKWLHWGVYNLPASAGSIPEGASLSKSMPRGSGETINSYDYLFDGGFAGWAGPGPVREGEAHQYRFQLMALDRKIPAPAKADCTDAESLYYLIEPWIIAETFITAYFGGEGE